MFVFDAIDSSAVANSDVKASSAETLLVFSTPACYAIAM